ncbi:unnamed protein product, partial [Rotaria sp. Silwood1]
LWDELAIFLGLFGSTRSDRASYDRGIMCELYNPTGVVRRQLVSRTNIMVKPRLCILAAGHPRETINCLTGSGFKTAEINDDGLFNRFLISVGYKQKPHRDCPPPDNKIPKLAHLFFYTHQLHKQTREYSFNEEGTFGPLDDFFKNLVLADSLNDDELIINYETCFNAKKMMDYFLSVKKILAGYDPIRNKIITDVDVDGIPQSDIDHIKSYIKNHPSERILLSTLPSNLKRKYTKEQYLPILQQLEADGHGIVTTTENTTGPKAICFAKKPRIEQPSESQNLIASSRS